MGICRAVQKKVLSIVNRVSPTTTEGVQGVTKAMPKFMFLEMTETNPKSVEKDRAYYVSIKVYGDVIRK